MRLLVLTLSAIAAGVGIHLALNMLPTGPSLKEVIWISHFLLPMIATAGLAYAMRVWNWSVVFLAIASPFAAMMSIVLFSMFVLNDNML